MEVGIFETIHFEGSYPVIKLFDNGKNRITIFTYEGAYQQFQHLFKENMSNYTWVIKNSSESRLQFIRRIYRHSKRSKFDILYLNTISDNHLAYALMIVLLRNMRIILTLHDINSHFGFRPGKTFRGWVRNTGKRILVSVVKEFNVVASTMIAYLRNKLPPHKKVHCVPGSVFEEEKRPRTIEGIGQRLKIVIPGSIDNRRRDYDLVFRLLEQINERKLKISIVLLGGISEYGTEILEKCKDYIASTAELLFFQTDIVDQPIFDREMDEADFIFIPSVINTVVSDGVPERYGLSISSGTIFDVIKHAKPMIVPEQLVIPANLESSTFKYLSSAEIILFLENFLLHPETYNEWQINALDNSRMYSIENIRKMNAAVFI